MELMNTVGFEVLLVYVILINVAMFVNVSSISGVIIAHSLYYTLITQRLIPKCHGVVLSICSEWLLIPELKE